MTYLKLYFDGPKRRPADSIANSAGGQTDTTSRQKSTTNGKINGQASTTTGQASISIGQMSTMSYQTRCASTTSDKTGSAIINTLHYVIFNAKV